MFGTAANKISKRRPWLINGRSLAGQLWIFCTFILRVKLGLEQMQKISLNCRPTSQLFWVIFLLWQIIYLYFGHITSDIILRRSAYFRIQTLNGLQTDFQLQISDFQLQTSNFGRYNWTSVSDLDEDNWLQNRILDFGHNFACRLWFLDFRFWTDIHSTSYFGFG